MTSDRTALLSGANGEPEDAVERAELLRCWGTPAPTERVGGFEYSLWKNPAPLPARVPRFSRTFVVALLAGCAALLAAGAWVAERTRQGDFLTAKGFALALVVLMYVAPLTAVVLSQRRRRAPEGEAESPPVGVPRHAVAACAGSLPRGRNVGWIWFEGDAMCFRGAGFDFRLRREDLVGRGSPLKSLGGKEGVALRRPKGISSHRLRVILGVIVNDAFYDDPKRWSNLGSEVSAWESGSFTKEPSLFPPVRPVPTVPPALGWRDWAAPALFMGLLLGGAGALLPPSPERAGNPPVVLGLVGALFGLMWPFLIFSASWTAKATNGEVDRAIRKGGAG